MVKNRSRDGLVHKHFIVDAELVKPLDFSKRKQITKNLIDNLIEELKMVPLGKLEIYDATDPNYPGWSFIQPITTSHISAHYFEEENIASHIHLDIYSCKNFSWKTLIKILEKHLKMDKWFAYFINRDFSMKSREVLTLNSQIM